MELFSLLFITIKSEHNQWAKSPKNSLKKCVFDNSALQLQRHIVKNILLQTAVSEILPTG